MNLKKNIGLGAAALAFGVALIGGGTYAFFNDTALTNSTFASGNIDLNVNPEKIIEVSNLKPGDTMTRGFKLINNGSLDISKVLLHTDYKVLNKLGSLENSEDFGKHIRVNFLTSYDKYETPLLSTTIAQLKTMSPDVVENKVFSHILNEEESGLKTGTEDNLVIMFEFVENGQDQNQFQGDSLQVKWSFEGKQEAGKSL